MANQTSKNKQHLHLTIDKKLVAMLDAEAARKGISRTGALVSILRAHFAEESDFNIIKARFDALEAQQQAMTATILDAVKNQPIAVQHPAPRLPGNVGVEEIKRMSWRQFRKWRKDADG